MLINEARPSLASLARAIWYAFPASAWLRSADKVSRNTQWILSRSLFFPHLYVCDLHSIIPNSRDENWMNKALNSSQKLFPKKLLLFFLKIKIAFCFHKNNWSESRGKYSPFFCNSSYYQSVWAISSQFRSYGRACVTRKLKKKTKRKNKMRSLA